MALITKPDIDEIKWALLDVLDPITAINNKVEPPTIKKNNGYNRLEKPPREYENYLKYRYYLWSSFINQFFDVFSGVTADATETEIFLNGVANSRLIVADNSNIIFKAIVSAFRDNSDESKSWEIIGEVIRNGSIYLQTNNKTVLSNRNWDIASGSYDSKSVSISAQESAIRCVKFSMDGTKMYIIGNTNDTVYQYTLSTPWDVSTAVYASKSLDVSTEEGTPGGMFFKPDGTKLYVCGAAGGGDIYQYTLSTPWDISTGSYDSVSFSTASQTSAPVGIFFKPDGNKFYVVGGGVIYQYSTGSAWSLTGSSYDSISLSVSAGTTDLFFKPDGKTLYTLDNTSNSFIQYSVPSSWILTGGATTGSTLSVNSQDPDPQGCFFDPYGVYFYMGGDNTDTVYQYAFSGFSWDINFEADVVNNALVPKVTGEAAKTINWKIKLEKLENTI